MAGAQDRLPLQRHDQRRRRAQPATHEQIVTTLRGFVGSRRRAPFVTELEPLLDVLVHTQDICVPLGIEHRMPIDAALAAADRVLSLRGPMRLWEPPRGVRLVTTDAEWTFGDGAVRQAPMHSHLLTLTGASAGADGHGVSQSKACHDPNASAHTPQTR